MKKFAMYYCHIMAIVLFWGIYSCKDETSDILGDFQDSVPENVRLAGSSNVSITSA